MARRSWFLAIAAATVLGCVYAALHGSLGGDLLTGDYPGPVCIGCDAAGPPIEWLAHGSIAGFFATQPFQGSFTLLLRVPFVAAVIGAHGGFVAQYRVGALVCLLLAAALLLPALRLMLRGGRSPLIVLVVAGTIVVGPATFKAIAWGHPEELVGGALAIAAVLAAGTRRPLAAGVLLGLAVATKQWGVFAILPVLMLARGRRRQVGAVAAAVAAAFILPMLAGDPHRFIGQNFDTAVAQSGVTPTNVWWFLHHVGFDPASKLHLNMVPDAVRQITHPLAVLLVVGISLLYWRRSEGRDPYDAVALLALLFLVRCLLDPLTMSYHHAPFMLSLAIYEGLRRRGLPVLTLISTAMLIVLARFISPLGDQDLMNAAYLAWVLPVALYLAASCLGPVRRARPVPRADPLPAVQPA